MKTLIALGLLVSAATAAAAQPVAKPTETMVERAATLKPGEYVWHPKAASGGSLLLTIDLTAQFCDARLCYPVIGGALVHKDTDHLTQVFSRTLGPFVLRAVDLVLPKDA